MFVFVFVSFIFTFILMWVGFLFICILCIFIEFVFLIALHSVFSSFIFVFFKVAVVSKSGSSKEQGEQTMVWKEVVVRKEKSSHIFLK